MVWAARDMVSNCAGSQWECWVMTGNIVDHPQELNLLVGITRAACNEEFILAGVPACCRDI